ncbi:FAD-dependent thymidylate synthase [Patescibacteria group bacterium]
MSYSSKNVKSVLGSINIPERFPFPYAPEKFTSKEKKILTQFFTNYDKPIYAIYNLPQEVVGAMFSRYSRTSKSVRRLFMDEFIKGKSARDFTAPLALSSAEERTKNFYKRVFAEFGDDSVIQMGSVHIAFEYVSQLAVKVIEDQRIGAAYIEKSTRYVDFGNKVNNHYLFTEPSEIMNSSYAMEYLAWNKLAFSSYIKALPFARKYFRKKFPLREQVFTNPKTGGEIIYKNIKSAKEKEIAKKAYDRASRARSFDSVRLFLPITIVSNLGAHCSGQSVENMINKMLSSSLAEIRLAGKMAYEELVKISPNFLQHIDHKYGEVQREYKSNLRESQLRVVDELSSKLKSVKKKNVRLVDCDPNALVKLASQIIYIYSRKGLSKKDVLARVKKLKEKELIDILMKAIDRKGVRLNRRHKLPRAFEHVFAEIEFYQDYGVYKDLQRNRMSTTERGFYLAEKTQIPDEYKDKGMEKVLESYNKLAKMTKVLQKKLMSSEDSKLQNAAEYIMLHGSMVRFSIKANLRQWVFFSELRTIEGGHPSYRNAMQKAAKEIIKVYPFMKPLFAYVNWTKDVGLGRLRAEIKTQEKLSKLKGN